MRSDERRQKRRIFSPEFKQGAVRLVLEEGKSRAEVARDLGVHESLIGTWVRQAEIDAGKGPAGALTTTEREELARLRKENRELRAEREMLKKAAAFFAKENT
jgi:transposase